MKEEFRALWKEYMEKLEEEELPYWDRDMRTFFEWVITGELK